jgi:hypothetical protein
LPKVGARQTAQVTQPIDHTGLTNRFFLAETKVWGGLNKKVRLNSRNLSTHVKTEYRNVPAEQNTVFLIFHQECHHVNNKKSIFGL